MSSSVDTLTKKAMELFNCAEKDVTPKMRQYVKQIYFGTLYVMAGNFNCKGTLTGRFKK